MTRVLTPSEAAIVAPLFERRALILAQANELARGIMAAAYAFHGEVAPGIEIRTTNEGGFVLIAPETTEDTAKRIADLVDGAPGRVSE